VLPRYDESTATAVGEGAELVHREYRDDLRELRDRADGDPAAIRKLLTGFPRLGPVGADIFCREAQAVWPVLRPALDGKVLDGAKAVGLPADAAAPAGLVKGDELAALASGRSTTTSRRRYAAAERGNRAG
jgi:hypothetical protein